MTEAEKLLPQLLAELKKSYHSQDAPVINHIGQSSLPSREVVVDILQMFREVFFPGFFGHQVLTRISLEYHIGRLLDQICLQLTDQISRSMRCVDPAISACRPGTCSECENIVAEFMKSIPPIRELLREDVQAAYDGDPAAKSIAEIIYSYPGLTAVMIYRLAHVLHRLKVPLIPRIMTEYAHTETGIDIHPGATIGHSFFIDHGAGVVIGETCVIGDRVKIYQGVTLGALSFPKDSEGNIIRDQKRHPTIEDDVVIYAGATVLGGDTTIGKGSVIGGNVWLTESLPPGSKVMITKPELLIRTSNPPGKSQ